MLVTSFFFSLPAIVLKVFLFQGRKNSKLCGKEYIGFKLPRNCTPACCYSRKGLSTLSVIQPIKNGFLNPLLHIYSFYNIEEKGFWKTLWKMVKSLILSNFSFFHRVFYAICILKSLNSHTSVVVCSFFEFGTVSKWCIREWLNFSTRTKFLDISKFKAFVDDKTKSGLNDGNCFSLRKHCGKREMTVTTIFMMFPQCFQMAFSS